MSAYHPVGKPAKMCACAIPAFRSWLEMAAEVAGTPGAGRAPSDRAVQPLTGSGFKHWKPAGTEIFNDCGSVEVWPTRAFAWSRNTARYPVTIVAGMPAGLLNWKLRDSMVIPPESSTSYP